jgi:hypothetical protein
MTARPCDRQDSAPFKPTDCGPSIRGPDAMKGKPLSTAKLLACAPVSRQSLTRPMSILIKRLRLHAGSPRCRQCLLVERAGMTVYARHIAPAAMGDLLDHLLKDHFGALRGLTIAAWLWIKAELNLRAWITALDPQGAQAAPPIVVSKGAPLDARDEDGT